MFGSIVTTESEVDALLLRDYFEAQQDFLDIVQQIETRILHRKGWQFWKGIEWCELEVAELAMSYRVLLLTEQSTNGFSLCRSLGNIEAEYSAVTKNLLDLGNLEYMNENDDDGERNLFECTSVIRQCFPDSNQRFHLAHTLHFIAGTVELEREQDAEILFRESLRIMRQLLGSDSHFMLAECLLSLGCLIRYETNSESASLYQEYVEVEKCMGYRNDPVDLSEHLYVLAGLLIDRNEFEEAKTHITECLQLRRELHGHGVYDFDITQTLRRFGFALSKCGNTDEAVSRLQECLKMEQLMYGEDVDDWELSDTYYTLGLVTEMKEELEEAELLYGECLEMTRRLVGNDQDNRAICETLHAAGRTKRKGGKLNEGELDLRNALRMSRRLSLDDLKDGAIIEYELGIVMEERGELYDAQALYRSSLDLFDEVHEFSCDAMYRLTRVLDKLGCLQNARELADEVLKMVQPLMAGCDKPETIESLVRATDLIQTHMTVQEAEDIYRTCSTIAMFEQYSLQERRAEIQLACFLVDNGMTNEATQLYQTNSAKDRALSLESDFYKLGDAFLRKNLVDGAKQIYLKGLNANSSCSKNDSSFVDRAVTLQILARLLADSKDLRKARKMFRKSLQLFDKVKEERHVQSAFHRSRVPITEIADECFDLGNIIFPQGLEHPGVSKILHALGLKLLEQGNYLEAEGYIQRSFSMRNRMLGEVDHVLIANSLDAMACICVKKIELTEAMRLLSQSLDMSYRLLGKQLDLGHISITLKNLADVHRDMGLLFEAESLYRRFLEARTGLYDFDSPVVEGLQGLAEAFLESGSRADAERLYREVFNTSTQEVSTTAFSFQALAQSAFLTGDEKHARHLLLESMEMYSRIDFLESCRKSLDDDLYFHAELNRLCDEFLMLHEKLKSEDTDSIAVAAILEAKGLVLQQFGSFDDAELWIRKSLGMKRRLKHQVSRADESVTVTLHTLAKLLIAKGEKSEAEEVLRESLQMQRELLSDEKVDEDFLVPTLDNLSDVLEEREEFEEALAITFESGTIKEARCGLVKYDVNLGTFHSRAARLQCATSDFAGAARSYGWIASFQKNLVLINKIDGTCLANTLWLRGKALLENFETDEAEETLRESVQLWRQIIGDGSDNIDFAGALTSLCVTLRRQNSKSDEAQKVLIEGLELLQRLNADSCTDQKLAYICYELGQESLWAGDYDVAQKLLLKGYPAMLEYGKASKVWDGRRFLLTQELGIAFGLLEQSVISERWHLENLTICRGAHGHEHQSFFLGVSLSCLAQVKLVNSSLHDAELLFRESILLSSSDSPWVGMTDFASLLERRGSLLESEHAFRKIFEEEVSLGLGDNHDFLRNIFVLAERHLEFGNLTEAERLYRSSFTIDNSLNDERLCLIMLLSEWALDYGYDSEAVRLFRECFDVAARGASEEAFEVLSELGELFRAAGLIDLVPL